MQTVKIQHHLQDIVDRQGDKPKWETKSTQLNSVTVSLSRQVINVNRQFFQLTNNLPAGWVVMVLDFVENYICKYQDEIQSAHLYHANATVHPIIACHTSPHCEKTMMTSLVMISPDNSFMDLAINHLKNQLDTDHITDTVRFSDGGGAQYNSKAPSMT